MRRSIVDRCDALCRLERDGERVVRGRNSAAAWRPRSSGRGSPATTRRLTNATAPASAAAPAVRVAIPAASPPLDQPRDRAASANSRSSGRAAQTMKSAESTATFVANSVVCGALSSAASRPIATAYTRRPTRLEGIVFGSVIMKNRKTRISGEKARTCQKYQSETGPRCQRAVIAWPLAASTAMHATNVTQKPIAIPSRRRRTRIASPPVTMIAIASASERRHRPPPELEWIGPLRAEQQEAQHEPEVRGVEDVVAPELDQVLGQQRDGGGAREDPPAVHAPPVAVLGPRHAEDEGDAVSREQRARRPEDHVLAPEGDSHLEHCAGEQRDEDLGDREPEVERDLPEHLQRDDHGREVQSRVADARQQDRVLRAADPHGRLAGGRGRAHRLMVCRDAANSLASGLRIGLEKWPGEVVLLADDDRVPSRSALGRRAVPPDRAAGQGGASARPARRGRPAADSPRGRRGSGDQSKHRGEGVSGARSERSRRGAARAGHVHHEHARGPVRSSTTRHCASELERWLEAAEQAGLDEESIRAVISTTLREAFVRRVA